MKKAYSLVELIFVIVIIGVLAGVASSSFKTDYLTLDAEFILIKIKQAQYKGIGYDHRTFGSTVAPTDFVNGCIRLEKSALEDKAINGKVAYKLHVDTFDAGVICFDAKGRAHDNDFSLATLRNTTKILSLTLNGVTQELKILPETGYVIRICN